MAYKKFGIAAKITNKIMKATKPKISTGIKKPKIGIALRGKKRIKKIIF